VRLAHKQLEAECGERLDEDELLHAMARAVLGPGRERAAVQIAVSVCSSCGVARQSAGGTDIALRPEEFERALCDAEWIDLSGQRRARQDVTPAVRKIVRHRDLDRCRIPGCRASTNTDVHHIVPRWAGGSHDPENLLVLCGGHHDALHRGDLRIEGPATAAVFSGTAIAQPAPAPESLDPESPRATFHVEDRPDHSSDAACTRSDALLALRTLGFTKAESLAAIESALVDLGATPPLETLVREALRRCPKP
jgi:hypothetical protein